MLITPYRSVPENYYTDKTNLEVPTRYAEILQEVIECLEKTGQPSNFNYHNDNYKNLVYFLKERGNSRQDLLYLEPVAVYTRDSHKFFLTKEDLDIILSYCPIVDVSLLVFF